MYEVNTRRTFNGQCVQFHRQSKCCIIFWSAPSATAKHIATPNRYKVIINRKLTQTHCAIFVRFAAYVDRNGNDSKSHNKLDVIEYKRTNMRRRLNETKIIRMLSMLWTIIAMQFIIWYSLSLSFSHPLCFSSPAFFHYILSHFSWVSLIFTISSNSANISWLRLHWLRTFEKAMHLQFSPKWNPSKILVMRSYYTWNCVCDLYCHMCAWSLDEIERLWF